jgi:hypothetical protein
MANPTGSTYLQANTGYVWTDGDTYEIVQTDQVEGGTPGVVGVGEASFSGLGVENQPHQILLNKIQYTHAHQLADEVNISNLLTFSGLFTSAVGLNGYLKVGAQDVNRGQIDIIFQWGTINTIGLPPQASGAQQFGFNFPIAFPNAIWSLNAWVFTGRNVALTDLWCTISTVGGIQKQGNTVNLVQLGPPGIYLMYQQPGNLGSGPAGISWWALGY